MTCFEILMVALTAVYVGTTIFYAVTSHKTLKAIKEQRQTSADQLTEMQKTGVQTDSLIANGTINAAAAQDSARALIASESAWIMAYVMQGPGLGGVIAGENTTGINVRFACTNQGKTPAWVDEVRCRLVYVKTIPTEPDLKNAEPYSMEPEPIAPGKDSSIETFHLQCDGHGELGDTLLIYGFVQYRDMFGSNRQTKFGYIVRFDNTLHRIAGYPKYNENT